MKEPLRIATVANGGFLVAPDNRDQGGALDLDKTWVFSSQEAMFEFIAEYFAPEQEAEGLSDAENPFLELEEVTKRAFTGEMVRAITKTNPLLARLQETAARGTCTTDKTIDEQMKELNDLTYKSLGAPASLLSEFSGKSSGPAESYARGQALGAKPYYESMWVEPGETVARMGLGSRWDYTNSRTVRVQLLLRGGDPWRVLCIGDQPRSSDEMVADPMALRSDSGIVLDSSYYTDAARAYTGPIPERGLSAIVTGKEGDYKPADISAATASIVKRFSS